jgi:hypothetical protein
MIDDRWYKDSAVGTYMDANGDGVDDFKGCCAGSMTCMGSASPRSG